MREKRMAWVDFLIIGIFISYSIFSGLRNKTVASQNLEEYFLAGRSLKGWQAGISMAATQFAADTPLLVTGLIATGGVFALWRLWIYAVAFLMMGFLLSPSWRRSNVLTDAELTEIRYGTKAASLLRGIKAIYLGTVFNCMVLSMVLLAATRIVEPFLTWNAWLPSFFFEPLLKLVTHLGIPLTTATLSNPNTWIHSTNNLISLGTIILVTGFYSTVGGLRSVVFTDIFHFCAAMTATAIFAWYVVDHAGGLDAIHEQITIRFHESNRSLWGINSSEILAFTPSLAKDSSLTVLLVLGFQWLVQMNSDGTGYLAQRSMACRSDRDAKVAAVVFTFAQVFLRSLLWLPIALGLLVIFPSESGLQIDVYTAQREFTYVRGMSELLPPGAKGLMVAGMLAALASTLDTHLNWGASYWTNDIYKRFICPLIFKKEPAPHTLVWVARGANVLTLAVTFMILPFLNSIQQAWQISLLLGSGMGILLVLRWIWWRINAWGELMCILTSLILTPCLLWLYPSNESLRLILMSLGATGVGIAASLITGPEEMDKLKEFYRLVRPPGFWGPVALGVEGHSRLASSRFYRGILTTFTAAFSVFCLLTSAGSYLAGSPSPEWFPYREGWLLSLFFIGISLIPVWVYLGFAPESEALSGETPFKESFESPFKGAYTSSGEAPSEA